MIIVMAWKSIKTNLMIVRYLLYLIIFSILISCSENTNDLPTSIYKITYFGNGNSQGSVPVDNNNYEDNDIAKIAFNQGGLKRERFSFIGWNTLADGSGTSYLEGDNITITNSNIMLYAQWEDNLILHELTSENQIMLNGLPEIAENDWYYATVNFVTGTLILDTEINLSNFQFHYKSGGDNYGYLRITQDFFNSTAVTVVNNIGVIKTLESGDLIDQDLFDNYSTAEISGYFHNWSNKQNIFLPTRLTIEGKIHFGFLKVSFQDTEGILTIHVIAYNRIPNESIIIP